MNNTTTSLEQYPLDWKRINALIKMALEEDLADRGDTTSQSVVPADLIVTAKLFCKEDCVCAGLPVAMRVFNELDHDMEWNPCVNEGDYCEAGTTLVEVKGNAQKLLTAERTALNFLQRLCGVATVSRRSAELTKGTQTVILDTRKTTPGWRNLEKYAVLAGGSQNHRIGLYDRVMIKDNHRALANLEGDDGIIRAVEKARAMYPDLEVEVEVDNLDEMKQALQAKADYILLDNMTNEQMSEAVKLNNGQSKLEASGGVTPERIPSICQTGVDFISLGALTHSVKATDISMELPVE